MKKLFHTLIFLSLLTGADFLEAQTTKGQSFISGGVDLLNESFRYRYNKNDYSNYKDLAFLVYAKGGYFIKENTALYFGSMFQRSTHDAVKQVYIPIGKNADGEEVFRQETVREYNLYQKWNVGVGLRRYLPLRKHLSVVFDGNLSFVSESSSYQETQIGQVDLDQIIPSRGFSLEIRPGLSYFLSSRFGVEAFLGGFSFNYATQKPIKYKPSISTGVYTIGFLEMGLTYYFHL